MEGIGRTGGNRTLENWFAISQQDHLLFTRPMVDALGIDPRLTPPTGAVLQFTLYIKWTYGDSNPELLRAKQACSH